MKHLLPVALLIASFSIQAEIYRGTDEEGNVSYSDKEQPNSELIPTPTPNVIQGFKPEQKEAAGTEVEESKDAAYKSFSIVSPANDSTAISSPGNLSISLSINPALNTKQGDYIRLYVDNRLVIKKTTSLSPSIPNIDRGSHSLKAELVSKSGKTLLSSSVQFHMKRFSSLH